MGKLSLILFGALLGVITLPYFVIRPKELPLGTNVRSEPYPASEIDLLVDRTRLNPVTGEVELAHEIFNQILSDIASAERFIIADFFLWNPWLGGLASDVSLRPLADELAQALIDKRIQNPDIPILVITDPINRIYGDHAPSYFADMQACLLYTSPSPRDGATSRMPSSA